MDPADRVPAEGGADGHAPGRDHPPPAVVTPLIGREAELKDLVAALADERVITLTGSGGCGKSSLAAEVARRVGVAEPPTGVVWLDLTACTDDDSVLSTITAAVTDDDLPRGSPLDHVVRSLRRQGRLLLVLDNAEHVLDPVATVTATIAAATEHVTVLCTSREPVGVTGEVTWRVPSLAMPPPDAARARDIDTVASVALFVDRARRVRRSFTLDDDVAPAVARICRRLDGMPLAIELAAACVRTMPPARIEAQLDDRFRLLTGGARTSTARQQTLQGSIEWSEALLDEDERTTFRRLGVFVGGFVTAAAEHVVGAFGDLDPYRVADTLVRLVDKNLVVYDAERDRYRLLDSLQLYARHRLDATGELRAARDAHAAWCAEWLAAAGADVSDVDDLNEWWRQRLRATSRVAAEWPNCATALGWVVPGSTVSLRLVAGLGDYWAVTHRVGDARRFGMTALAAGDRTDPAWLAAVVALQTIGVNAGDRSLDAISAEAAALAADAGDRWATRRLGFTAELAQVIRHGPRPELLAAVDENVEAARAAGDWYTTWNGTQAPAVMLAIAGQPEAARARIDGLDGARAAIIRSFAALAQGDVAEAATEHGAARRALDGRSGAANDRMLLTLGLADLALATDDVGVLEPLGLDDLDPADVPPLYAHPYAVLHLLSGSLAPARDLLAGAGTHLFASNRALATLAPIELSLGHVDAAAAVARRLLDVGHDVPAPAFTAVGELVLAECARTDDPRAAIEHAHRALATAAAAALWPAAANALEALVVLLADGRRHEDAGRLLAATDAWRAASGDHYRFPHRRAALDALRPELVAGDPSEPPISLAAAIELAQRMRGERLRPSHGWDSLTPTEARVVAQVAAGMTNPQIAAALFMSRSTVKTHLVHVYAKLGIASRAELAAAAARREP